MTGVATRPSLASRLHAPPLPPVHPSLFTSLCSGYAPAPLLCTRASASPVHAATTVAAAMASGSTARAGAVAGPVATEALARLVAVPPPLVPEGARPEWADWSDPERLLARLHLRDYERVPAPVGDGCAAVCLGDDRDPGLRAVRELQRATSNEAVVESYILLSAVRFWLLHRGRFYRYRPTTRESLSVAAPESIFVLFPLRDTQSERHAHVRLRRGALDRSLLDVDNGVVDTEGLQRARGLKRRLRVEFTREQRRRGDTHGNAARHHGHGEDNHPKGAAVVPSAALARQVSLVEFVAAVFRCVDPRNAPFAENAEFTLGKNLFLILVSRNAVPVAADAVLGAYTQCERRNARVSRGVYTDTAVRKDYLHWRTTSALMVQRARDPSGGGALMPHVFAHRCMSADAPLLPEWLTAACTVPSLTSLCFLVSVMAHLSRRDHAEALVQQLRARVRRRGAPTLAATADDARDAARLQFGAADVVVATEIAPIRWRYTCAIATRDGQLFVVPHASALQGVRSAHLPTDELLPDVPLARHFTRLGDAARVPAWATCAVPTAWPCATPLSPAVRRWATYTELVRAQGFDAADVWCAMRHADAASVSDAEAVAELWQGQRETLHAAQRCVDETLGLLPDALECQLTEARGRGDDAPSPDLHATCARAMCAADARLTAQEASARVDRLWTALALVDPVPVDLTAAAAGGETDGGAPAAAAIATTATTVVVAEVSRDAPVPMAVVGPAATPAPAGDARLRETPVVAMARRALSSIRASMKTAAVRTYLMEVEPGALQPLELALLRLLVCERDTLIQPSAGAHAATTATAAGDTTTPLAAAWYDRARVLVRDAPLASVADALTRGGCGMPWLSVGRAHLVLLRAAREGAHLPPLLMRAWTEVWGDADVTHPAAVFDRVLEAVAAAVPAFRQQVRAAAATLGFQEVRASSAFLRAQAPSAQQQLQQRMAGAFTGRV